MALPVAPHPSDARSRSCRAPNCAAFRRAPGPDPDLPAAAEAYDLGRGPSVLAAINKIETGFGQNLGPSSAGAYGWMQFMPATWAAYGVDADRDGGRDPADPDDAIHAAARYLRASGRRATGTARSSPTTTPTGTSARSSPGPPATAGSATAQSAASP